MVSSSPHSTNYGTLKAGCSLGHRDTGGTVMDCWLLPMKSIRGSLQMELRLCLMPIVI